MSQAFEFFEIDIPYCSLTYGVAPCAAALGVTGDAKCFNTLATCQDTDNIDLGTVTLRFAKPADYLPRDIDCLPWITGIEFNAATVSLGESLGTRAQLKVTLSDHRHSDAGVGLDKYHAERGYNPYERGSFWPRFRARHLSLKGVACRWIIGAVGQSLDEMEARHYFVESYDGPRVDGQFTIVATDALKFLSGDRAQAPLPTSGILLGAIDVDDVSATLSAAGVGNAEYPASGYVRIGGKEDCAFTRSGDNLTLTRGSLGTTASSHAAGDRVQLVLRYDAEDPADIINDLIDTYTEMPSARLDLALWQDETAAHLAALYTYTIGEPTPVEKIVSRVIQQAGLALWDDALAQKLRLKVIKAVPIGASTIDESSVISRSFDVQDQPDKRVSQAWVYYAQNDPTKRLEDPDNYRQIALVQDADSEVLYGSRSIVKVFADGIPAGGSTAAGRAGALVVGRHQRPPRRFKFSQLRGQDSAVRLGEGINIDWRSLQDASGAREVTPAQIIRDWPGPAIRRLEAEEMRFGAIGAIDFNTRVIRIDFNGFNLNLRSIHDALFPATFGGDVTVTFEITSTIGSTSTANAAINVGAWPSEGVTGNRTGGSAVITGLAATGDYAAGMPVTGTSIPAGTKILSVDSSSQITLTANATSGAGTATALTIWLVPITIKLSGRIQGRGSDGAVGGNPASINGNAGNPGGTALYTRYPVEIETAAGEIWGGGGGGAGGGSALDAYPGAPGGGGAGTLPGLAGPLTQTIALSASDGQDESGGGGGVGAGTIFDFGGNGGSGGDAGQPGGISSAGSAGNPALGGAAGKSIDGVSYCAFTDGAGDRRGPEVN